MVTKIWAFLSYQITNVWSINLFNQLQSLARLASIVIPKLLEDSITELRPNFFKSIDSKELEVDAVFFLLSNWLSRVQTDYIFSGSIFFRVPSLKVTQWEDQIREIRVKWTPLKNCISKTILAWFSDSVYSPLCI